MVLNEGANAKRYRCRVRRREPPPNGQPGYAVLNASLPTCLTLRDRRLDIHLEARPRPPTQVRVKRISGLQRLAHGERVEIAARRELVEHRYRGLPGKWAADWPLAA